jgi:hypothetical protein
MKKPREFKKVRAADGVIKVRLLASGELISEEWGSLQEFERLKSRRASLTLGPGEVEPADRRREVYGLRNLFLERVRELELKEERARKKAEEAKRRLKPPPASDEWPKRPLKVLRALAGPPYRELLKSGATDGDLLLLLWDASSPDGADLPARLAGLRDSVLDWTRSSNLRAGFGEEETPRGGGWCAERAYSTLWLWRESKEAFENLEWENGARLVMTVVSDDPAPESVGPVHSFPAWFPDSEPLKSYEKAVREKAGRLVEEFVSSGSSVLLSLVSAGTVASWVDDVVSAVVDAARSQARGAYLGGAAGGKGESGWSRAKTSRSLLKKIDWTIDATVRGMELKEVATIAAGTEGLNLGDVSSGVSEVSGLIDLRKGDAFKRGRRKGSRDGFKRGRRKGSEDSIRRDRRK